jgi:hypothetical protein
MEDNLGDNLGDATPAGSDVIDNIESHRQVPLDALEAERSKRQDLQEELRMMKEHMALMQALPAQKPKSELDHLQDEDVLTVGEAKKFINQLNSQYKMSLDEIKISQRHSDYDEVVRKYLPEVLKQNPSLKGTLQQSQDFELAYYLAKNSDAYQKANKRTKINSDAEKIVQNSSKSGSLSSVGQNSPISEARRWKDMSDDDFRKEASKHMGYY